MITYNYQNFYWKMPLSKFYWYKNEIARLEEVDKKTTLRVQTELNRMDDIENEPLELIYWDSDTAFFRRRNNYYGLSYNDMEKSDFRKYANQETIVCETEKNEDGGVDYYYDDDSWDIEPDMLQDYANDYVKCNVKFGRSGNNIEYGSGTIFEIQKNDDWHETLLGLSKQPCVFHKNKCDCKESIIDEWKSLN